MSKAISPKRSPALAAAVKSQKRSAARDLKPTERATMVPFATDVLQAAEGDQFLSTTITPRSAKSKVTVVASIAMDGAPAAPAQAVLELYVPVPTTGEQIQQIAIKLLHVWPGNPRETIDEKADKELAESLFQDGLLENLIARPHPDKPGEFEVIAGGRRLRSSKMLVKDRRWTLEQKLPVMVHACDDLEALRLGGIENVKRESMSPLDEGKWCKRMADAGYSTEKQLPAMIGKSTRWIQKRMKLVEKLAPAAKDALRDGKITVRQAEAVSEAPTPERQASLVKEINRGTVATETQIREAITRDLPPERAAHFDVALYTGDWVQGAGGKDGRCFADVAQFEKLQGAAIDATEAKLKGKWKWVETRSERRGQWFQNWEWGRSEDAAKAGAIIHIKRDGSVMVHTGLLKDKDRPAETSIAATRKANGGQAEVPATQALMIYARKQKTSALQLGIIADAETAPTARMAKIMVCIALLGDSENVAIDLERLGRDDNELAPAVAEAIGRARAPIGALLTKADGAGVFRLKGFSRARMDAAGEAFRLMHKMSDADLGHLFAGLVAWRCGTFNSANSALGDSPVAQRAAAALKIDMAARWGRSKTGWADYLKLCKKGRLVGLVRAMPRLGIDPLAAESTKTSALAAEILAAVAEKKLQGVVPPELLFGDKAAIEKALKTKRVKAHKPAKPAAKVKGKAAKVVKFPKAKGKAADRADKRVAAAAKRTRRNLRKIAPKRKAA